jgi:hypothetical protein
MTQAQASVGLDRYVSFIGLDCDGKAERFVAALRESLGDGTHADPFWLYFRAKLDGERGPAHDALYHIHANLNPLRDMLDRALDGIDHATLIELLDALEHECC